MIVVITSNIEQALYLSSLGSIFRSQPRTCKDMEDEELSSQINGWCESLKWLSMAQLVSQEGRVASITQDSLLDLLYYVKAFQQGARLWKTSQTHPGQRWGARRTIGHMRIWAKKQGKPGLKALVDNIESNWNDLGSSLGKHPATIIRICCEGHRDAGFDYDADSCHIRRSNCDRDCRL